MSAPERSSGVATVLVRTHFYKTGDKEVSKIWVAEGRDRRREIRHRPGMLAKEVEVEAGPVELAFDAQLKSKRRDIYYPPFGYGGGFLGAVVAVSAQAARNRGRVEADCDAQMTIDAQDGAVYHVDYKFFGHNRCTIECTERVGGTEKKCDATMFLPDAMVEDFDDGALLVDALSASGVEIAQSVRGVVVEEIREGSEADGKLEVGDRIREVGLSGKAGRQKTLQIGTTEQVAEQTVGSARYLLLRTDRGVVTLKL